MIDKLTVLDAAEAAVLVTESIEYADAHATGGLAFPAALNRAWRASDVLGHQEHFDTSWAYREGGRMMAVVIGAIEQVRGQAWYRIIIGATRISEIIEAEHAAYLSMPLREALPDARARFGVVGTHLTYIPAHGRLDAYMKSWSRSNGETVREGGELTEVFLPMSEGVPEIVARTQILEGRDSIGPSGR